MTCRSTSPARPIVRANHNALLSVVPSPAMMVLVVGPYGPTLCAASAGARQDVKNAAIAPRGARGPDGGMQHNLCPRWTIPPPPRRWPSSPNRHVGKRLDRNALASLVSVGIFFGW